RWVRYRRSSDRSGAATDLLRHALQERLFGGGNGVRGSDMHPDAVEAQAEQALGFIGAVEHLRQREFALGGIGKNRRRDDRGTGIDERHHLVLTPLAQG